MFSHFFIGELGRRYSRLPSKSKMFPLGFLSYSISAKFFEGSEAKANVMFSLILYQRLMYEQRQKYSLTPFPTTEYLFQTEILFMTINQPIKMAGVLKSR